MTANELSLTCHPFLEGLSGKQLEAVAALAMPVTYRTGETIFKEGDLADRFYLIHSGSVILSAGGRADERVHIQQLGPGDVLGWSWLFEPYSWQYDAVAASPTTATFLYGTWLRDRCEQDTALGYEVMKRIAAVVIARLQAARGQLMELRTSA